MTTSRFHLTASWITFQELLGDRLLTCPVQGDGASSAGSSSSDAILPSPNQLKYKILIKNKKLRSSSTNIVSKAAAAAAAAASVPPHRTATVDDPTSVSTASGEAAGTASVGSGGSGGGGGGGVGGGGSMASVEDDYDSDYGDDDYDEGT